ncbi:MAG: M28 family peptidase [Promethearchaeota archaeon]
MLIKKRGRVSVSPIMLILVFLPLAFSFHNCNIQFHDNEEMEYDLSFSDDLAWTHLENLFSLNPRHPGTQGNDDAEDYISGVINSNNGLVYKQEFIVNEIACTNIIGKWHSSNASDNVIILASHYDSRAVADHDPSPENRDKPVPGANDGGSSTAILLALAPVVKALMQDDILNFTSEIWLVFFDAEDQGSGAMAGFNWIEGSKYLADNIDTVLGENQTIEYFLLLDMVGDDDLHVNQELNSNQALLSDFFSMGRCLGHGSAFPTNPVSYKMIDDHVPFKNLGIPTLDIIDFDYPEWHTISDDMNHISKASMELIGRVTEAFIISREFAGMNLTIHDNSSGYSWQEGKCEQESLPSPVLIFFIKYWLILALIGVFVLVFVFISLHGNKTRKTREAI